LQDIKGKFNKDTEILKKDKNSGNEKIIKASNLCK
jgi:hypothetical protein